MAQGTRRGIRLQTSPRLWNGLDPFLLLPRRRLGTKPDRDGVVGVLFHALLVAVDAGRLLVGFQQRARLSVVDLERPEIVRGDWRRQGDLVGLAAIEIERTSLRSKLSSSRTGFAERFGDGSGAFNEGGDDGR
jgi:hypothetical protein